MKVPLTVFNYRSQMARYKSGDPGIEYTRTTFVVLVRFLQNSKLLKRTIIDDQGCFDENTVLREDDLTKDGLALFWGQFIDKWLDQHDRGTEVSNVNRLAKALEKIRSEGAQEFIKKTRYYLYHTDKKQSDPL